MCVVFWGKTILFGRKSLCSRFLLGEAIFLEDNLFFGGGVGILNELEYAQMTELLKG